jgi:hypothetical protein
VKWIGLTSLVSAFAVMTLGCVRGLTEPTAAGGTQANTVKPEIISSEVTILWARHQHLPREWSAAAGRPDLRGDARPLGRRRWRKKRYLGWGR